jgi:hypothetical protein
MADPNVMVADEDENGFSFDVRSAALECFQVAVERFSSKALQTLIHFTMHTMQSADSTKPEWYVNNYYLHSGGDRWRRACLRLAVWRMKSPSRWRRSKFNLTFRPCLRTSFKT